MGGAAEFPALNRCASLRRVNEGRALAAFGLAAKLGDAPLGSLHVRHAACSSKRISVAPPEVFRMACLSHRSDSQVWIGDQEEIDNPGMGTTPLQEHLVHPALAELPQLRIHINCKKSGWAPVKANAVDKFS